MTQKDIQHVESLMQEGNNAAALEYLRKLNEDAQKADEQKRNNMEKAVKAYAERAKRNDGRTAIYVPDNQQRK